MEIGRRWRCACRQTARVVKDSAEEVDAKAAGKSRELGAGASEAFERAAAPYPSGDEWSSLPLRPPTVAVLGHVDHGKTTLLDALRGTSTRPRLVVLRNHLSAFTVGNSTFPRHAATPPLLQRCAKRRRTPWIVGSSSWRRTTA